MRFVENQHARLGRTARHGPDLLYRLAEHERRATEAALRAQAHAVRPPARERIAGRVRLQCPIRLRSPIRLMPPEASR